MEYYDLVVVGGGPAGLAAALAAKENGIDHVIILERENVLGGILNQCIHNGFGLHYFKEELTGPEYADRFVKAVMAENIEYKIDTMVLDITEDKCVTAVNSKDGIIEIKAGAIILAMGCRERPRGAINIPGSRCAGVYNAGTAQKYVNIEGVMPGKEVVILGSGDIGLIMARRMTIEGAKVRAVVELMPYSSGLNRNIVQCLDDFDIPLLLSHTVTNIKGKERLEGVSIAKVDENRRVISGSEEFIPCDTLLLSVGLLPENELSRKANVKLSKVTGGAIVTETMETNIDGVFACGNVLHVHDLVDNVTKESMLAGKNAAKYLKNELKNNKNIQISTKNGVRYTVPMTVCPDNLEETSSIYFRVDKAYKDHYVSVYFGNERVIHNKKRMMTPGEMEYVKLTSDVFESHNNCNELTIMIERA